MRKSKFIYFMTHNKDLANFHINKLQKGYLNIYRSFTKTNVPKNRSRRHPHENMLDCDKLWGSRATMGRMGQRGATTTMV